MVGIMMSLRGSVQSWNGVLKKYSLLFFFFILIQKSTWRDWMVGLHVVEPWKCDLIWGPRQTMTMGYKSFEWEKKAGGRFWVSEAWDAKSNMTMLLEINPVRQKCFTTPKIPHILLCGFWWLVHFGSWRGHVRHIFSCYFVAQAANMSFPPTSRNMVGALHTLSQIWQ